MKLSLPLLCRTKIFIIIGNEPIRRKQCTHVAVAVHVLCNLLRIQSTMAYALWKCVYLAYHATSFDGCDRRKKFFLHQQ